MNHQKRKFHTFTLEGDDIAYTTTPHWLNFGLVGSEAGTTLSIDFYQLPAARKLFFAKALEEFAASLRQQAREELNDRTTDDGDDSDQIAA